MLPYAKSDGPTPRASLPLRALFRIIVGKEQEILVDEVGKTRRSGSVGVGNVGGVGVRGTGRILAVGGVRGVER